MEKDCYSAVRHSEIETQDILKIRKREEMAIVLETSFFDANDDEAKTNKRDEAKENSKDVSFPVARWVVIASVADGVCLTDQE